MQDFWNDRYGAQQYAYGKTPNLFFKEFIDNHPPGNILLPADGEGRNAVYAALKGWNVDAFDFSQSGQTKALALAIENEVNINFEVASFQEYLFKMSHYDVVGLFYVHQPEAIRKFLYQNIINTLKPGGQIVLECFSKEQISKLSGGPKKEAMLGSIEMMEEDFGSEVSGMEIEYLKKENIILQEGKYHVGDASVIRMIAKKRNKK